MEFTADLSRWRETPKGVGYRRLTIVMTGLRQVCSTRFFRILLVVAWLGGLFLAAGGYVFSQSVASGGWLETLAAKFGPRPEAVMAAATAIVMLYPDIVVHGVFTLLFWTHSLLGLVLSLFALTAIVPRLITRDRASNALIVYLARPLTTVDYLIGKLGIIAGVLSLVWTGPLLFGWLLSILFASTSDFFIYSLSPLGRGLAFNAIALVSLATIALGVSAVSRTSRNTIVVWLALSLVMWVVSLPPRQAQWLKRASFVHNLVEVRQGIFRMDVAFQEAADKLPLSNKRFVKNMAKEARENAPKDYRGALASLAGFCVASSFIFLRRIRPE